MQNLNGRTRMMDVCVTKKKDDVCNKFASTMDVLIKSARLCTRDREHARSCFAARRRQRALWSADRQARSLRRARWPPATRGQRPARVGWRCQVSPAGDEAADSFPSSSSVTVGTATTAAACQFLPCFSRLAPARAPWTAPPRSGPRINEPCITSGPCK